MQDDIYSDTRRTALKNLDKSEYPALYKMLFIYWSDRLFRTLEYYWRQQDTKQNQHYNPDAGGYYEFTETVRYSAEHASYISNDRRVWQRNRVLLHCLGLISTRRAKPRKPGEYIPEYDHWTVVNMAKKGYQQPSTIITTQLWTLDMLDYSEAQAKKWTQKRTSARYLTKETIINIYGKDLADQIYNDSRGIPDSSADAISKLKKAIVKTSKAKGYTTKEKVLTEMQKSTGKIKADKTWSEYIKQILYDIGYKHHKPTKADKARYNIKPNDNRWIITPIQDNKSKHMLEADE
jgi:hypothetical protein